MVLLPAPAGPSMAMISLRGSVIGKLMIVHAADREVVNLRGRRSSDSECGVDDEGRSRATPCGIRPSAMFDEGAGLQFRHRLTQLFLRIHHNGPIPRNRFLDRLD